MFKHILIPTDGSKLSAKGVRSGLRLAKALGARVTMGQPWQAILQTARFARCDAIVMGSHGRGGLAGLILGSETTHVLAKSSVPVLVVR